MRHACTATTILLLANSAFAQGQAASWPQWRGPTRDGISTEELRSKQTELWATNVGLGYSTVSVANGRIYTMGHDKAAKKDTVFCIEADTGIDVWTKTFDCQTLNRFHGGGSQTTPSLDGDRLYVSGREGKLFCLDAKTGKEIWKQDLSKEYGLRLPLWGWAASPLILDDMIVLSMGHVFAFKRDGKLLWKTEENFRTSYSTPVDCKLYGRDCIADFNGHGIVILDRKSGEMMSQHKWATRSGVNVASPIVIGDRIFISSGYNTGCAMLQTKGNDKLEVLWENREMRNHMSGCVYHKGHLYGFDESTLKCLDLQGEVKWAERGLGKGALVMASGKLAIMSARGELVIADASADGFEEVSRTKVLSGGVYWTTPVVCGGRLYVRNSIGDLVCLE